MAQLEHELWRQAKLADGWRLGPVKGKKKHTHPALVPWEKLSDDEREKNRTFIHKLPSLLARLGFQIDRAEDIQSLK
jgi:hypothetical protein